MSSAWVETILLEASDEIMVASVKKVFTRYDGHEIQRQEGGEVVRIPSGATRRGVSTEEYLGYRRGLMSACADAVCVRNKDGILEVPLISRAKPPFEGGWWVQGGAIFNFRPISEFVSWKILKESGCLSDDIGNYMGGYKYRKQSDPAILYNDGVHIIMPPLGIYRTAAADSLPEQPCDTLNIAYLALWPAELPFGHDKDHAALRWVTLPELLADGNLCGHWYPQHLATRALKIVAEAKRILSA